VPTVPAISPLPSPEPIVLPAVPFPHATHATPLRPAPAFPYPPQPKQSTRARARTRAATETEHESNGSSRLSPKRCHRTSPDPHTGHGQDTNHRTRTARTTTTTTTTNHSQNYRTPGRVSSEVLSQSHRPPHHCSLVLSPSGVYTLAHTYIRQRHRQRHTHQ
jgi:septal ring-binding cell division protein DamX